MFFNAIERLLCVHNTEPKVVLVFCKFFVLAFRQKNSQFSYFV